MKHILHLAPVSLLACTFLLNATSTMAQGVGMGAAPPSGGAERWMADTIYVPPGMVYTASYYCWSDGAGTISADWTLAQPVSWLDNITFPIGQTTDDCAHPFVIQYRVSVPLTYGVYEAQFVDQMGLWPDWIVRLKVVEIPTAVDQVIDQTLLVNQSYQFPYAASGSIGVVDIGCTAQPFLPTAEVVWVYYIHPVVPWLVVTPESITVPAGTTDYVSFDVSSAVPGLFTTYVYNTGTWYGWPYITQVNVTFEDPTGIGASQEVGSALQLSPNPAQQSIMLKLPTTALRRNELLDASGRLLRSFTSTGTTQTLALDDLLPGLYWVRSTSGESVVVARFMKE